MRKTTPKNRSSRVKKPKKLSKSSKKTPTRRKKVRNPFILNNLGIDTRLHHLPDNEHSNREQVSPIEDKRLPSAYGETRIVLMVRDPWWLYTYWEITPEREKEVLQAIANQNQSKARTIIRVYDITARDIATAHSYFDITLHFNTDNWYIDVGVPDRQWVVEIGFMTPQGQFFVLARSNTVKTPGFGLSDIQDEEWMLPEEAYRRLLGMSGSFGVLSGSMELRKMIEKNLMSSVSSTGVPNRSKSFTKS